MSVSLAAPSIQQYTVGGIVSETNDSSGLVSTTIDYQAGVMTWTFATGSRTNGTITVGTHGSQTQIIFNLATGAWTNGQTGATGTVANGGLVTLNTALKALRNGIESAAVVQTIVNGTQVPW